MLQVSYYSSIVHPPSNIYMKCFAFMADSRNQGGHMLVDVGLFGEWVFRLTDSERKPSNEEN